MAIPFMSITPLQWSPNSLIDFSGVRSAIKDYSKGAAEAEIGRELGRAGRMDPEAGARHLMGLGLHEQGRAMQLFPRQLDALGVNTALARARTTTTLDENTRAQGLHPAQKALIEAQAAAARQQAATAAAEQATRARLLEMLTGGGPGTGRGLSTLDFGIVNPNQMLGIGR